LLRQTILWADPCSREQVVRKLYSLRFREPLDESLTLKQIRGKEGIRVREAYARAGRDTGVQWTGRSYDRGSWAAADPVNRALSAANSCLYGICHAGILALGLSPALGFIHTGKMLSFVYDVADLYKTDTSIPMSFREVAKGEENLESRVRRALRDMLKEQRLLVRIVDDVQSVLDLKREGRVKGFTDFDSDPAFPGSLWDPIDGQVNGGVNFAEDTPEGGGDGSSDP
jgi:CRISPR-associated protein Cas1